MTLEEISDSLPHGFHDAQIKKLNLDYVNREATFDLEIWIGTDSSRKREERDAYRAAQLTLSQLLFCVIEPPDPNYPYQERKPLWVDAGSSPSNQISTSIRLPEPLPEGAFIHWFFANNWNAFIHVAAKNARLEFLDSQ
jgi:hypothetical protein